MGEKRCGKRREKCVGEGVRRERRYVCREGGSGEEDYLEWREKVVK